MTTTPKNTDKKSAKIYYTKEQLLHFYREMLSIRRFEERADWRILPPLYWTRSRCGGDAGGNHT